MKPDSATIKMILAQTHRQVMTSDQPDASKLCIKVHLSVQQTDNALLTRNKTFITHVAGFACFNVCAHLNDAIMLSAFGLCITQPQALLHHPCAHTLKHSKSAKCVLNLP